MRTIVLTAMIVCCSFCVYGQTISSVDKVSWIKYPENYEIDKLTMMYEGEPFFLHVAEFSINRFFNKDLFGWEDAAIEKVIQQVSADGFTCIKLPYYWGQIESSKDKFDWTMIDRSIDFCVRAELPIIFNWWGSEFVGASWILDGLLPDYATKDFTFVTNEDGSRFEVNYRYHLDTRAYPKLDKTDDKLLERESYVLKRIMDHIYDYIKKNEYPNIVLAVQVQNEPTTTRLWGHQPDRSYSKTSNEKWEKGNWSDPGAFRRHVMFNYMNELGRAVKTSKYNCITTVNWTGTKVDGSNGAMCISENEVARAKGESYIDFMGIDLYKPDDPDSYHQCMTDRYFMQGSNFLHVPETGASYDNYNHLHFIILSANGTLGLWEVLQSGDWHWAAHMNMYTSKEDQTFVPTNEIKNKRIVAFNNFLLKNKTALATLNAGGQKLKYQNYKFEPYAEEYVKIDGKNLTFKTRTGSGGIVSAIENGLVLMTTDFAEYQINANKEIKSIESGYFNENNEWVSRASKTIQASSRWKKDSKIDNIEMNPYDVVRVLFK